MLAKGVKRDELFGNISAMLDKVSKVSVLDGRETRVVTDPSLWRFDPEGIHIRLFKDDPELSSGFKHLSLDCCMGTDGDGLFELTCKKIENDTRWDYL